MAKPVHDEHSARDTDAEEGEAAITEIGAHFEPQVSGRPPST